MIDPESGTDAVRNVGIIGDRIAVVSKQPLDGERLIDAEGLVVAPGFIDLHNHAFNSLSQEYQVRDGVTTALNLESGSYPLASFAAGLADGSRMNIGASVGYSALRRQVMRAADSPPDKATEVGQFADDLLNALEERLETGLRNGGLGIGLPLDYISRLVGRSEMHRLFEVAGRNRAPVFVHIRRGVNGDPAGLVEVLELARQYGAPLHVCHITHSGMRNTGLFLDLIREAREAGVDVTTEILPFNAGSTSNFAAVFGRNWREIFDIDYGDVQWAATGEFFTEETWNQYREAGRRGAIIHHYVREEWNRRAITEPGVMVVSDMLRMRDRATRLAPHHNAFSRVLGRYVREQRLLTLPDAIARMTYLPALRLEDLAPVFARKGRVQAGADADITVFDPDIIVDAATYEKPFQASTGIMYVLVNGTVVVEQGNVVADALPGRRLAAHQVDDP